MSINWWAAVVAQLVQQLTNYPKIEGLKPTAAGTGENDKKFVKTMEHLLNSITPSVPFSGVPSYDRKSCNRIETSDYP